LAIAENLECIEFRCDADGTSKDLVSLPIALTWFPMPSSSERRLATINTGRQLDDRTIELVTW
jgi:hypothetical protein